MNIIAIVFGILVLIGFDGRVSKIEQRIRDLESR